MSTEQCLNSDEKDYETKSKYFSIKQKSNNSMTEGNIVKKLLLFSFPLILGNLLQQMYNTADSIIVGNYVGSEALAAVGSSASLINLLISFSQGIAIGAGVLISQAIGANEYKEIQKSVHTSLSISLLIGLFLSIVGIIFTPQFLIIMKTPKEVMNESVTYLRMFSFGLVFSVIYNMEAGILNAVGNSKRSLLYLAIASATNIILDLFFIKILKLGVLGAAVATNISQAISCILGLIFLIRTDNRYRVNLKQIKIHKNTAIKMIKVGLPTGIQNMVISLSNVLVQSSINIFGSITMAGFAAYMKIDGFNILPVMSLSMASTIFTGQNYGAGNKARIKQGMWITIIISLIYTSITGILLLTFSNFIVGLFTKDINVMNAGVLAMKFFCPFYFLLAILQCLAGTVRGAGKTISPMVILIVSMCLFRIIWLQFIFPYFNTVESIYILYPISWGIGTILIILYTWKSKWLE